MAGIDEAKRAAEICQEYRERVAKWSDSLRSGNGYLPAWWGWVKPVGGDVNVNDNSNGWWPLAFIAAIALIIFWKPTEKPAEASRTVAASPQGTAVWQKQKKDGSWEVITSAPDKELPDGRIQTQDGRIWTRNPDGTLSEVK